MKTIFTAVSILLCNILLGQENDSNIVISNAQESYSFNYIAKEKVVKVNEELSNTYQCINYRTDIPIVEYYDNETNIDDLTVLVNEHKQKNIGAKYDYYSSDDIFYSDAHVCHFKLPLEKKGSTSQVNFSKTINNPRYFTSIYFSDEYFIVSKTISVIIPKWMNVELKEYNFEGTQIKKTSHFDADKNANVITFTIKNLPAHKAEGNSAGPSYTEPHVLILSKNATTPDGKITFFNTLDDQYAWYRTLVKDLPVNAEVIKAKASEITTGSTTDLDKIKKVFYWMHDNIRYIAFENGIAGFKPEKADEVLRKKYGDCKGMANLTKELLKALGFDARLCWIGTNHIAYDYSTPSIAVDNHMICALIYHGKTYFLDATENYIGFNEYAERIEGRQVLIEDGDKYIYTKVPVTTYMQNLDAEKSTIKINGKDIEGNVNREWKGEEKENIFYELNSIKKENSVEAFKKFLSKNNSDFSIVNFTTSDLTNYDKSLTVKYDFKHANAVSVFGNEMYVDVDYRKDLLGFVIDTKKRQHDYWFGYKLNTLIEEEIIIPAGYAVTSAPPNLTVKNDDYEFSASITKLPNSLKYSKSIFIKNPYLKKAKFEQWNKDIEKLTAFYNEQIVLTKK